MHIKIVTFVRKTSRGSRGKGPTFPLSYVYIVRFLLIALAMKDLTEMCSFPIICSAIAVSFEKFCSFGTCKGCKKIIVCIKLK